MNQCLRETAHNLSSTALPCPSKIKKTGLHSFKTRRHLPDAIACFAMDIRPVIFICALCFGLPAISYGFFLSSQHADERLSSEDLDLNERLREYEKDALSSEEIDDFAIYADEGMPSDDSDGLDEYSDEVMPSDVSDEFDEYSNEGIPSQDSDGLDEYSDKGPSYDDSDSFDEYSEQGISSDDRDEYADEGMSSDDSDDLDEYADEGMSSDDSGVFKGYSDEGKSSDNSDDLDEYSDEGMASDHPYDLDGYSDEGMYSDDSHDLEEYAEEEMSSDDSDDFDEYSAEEISSEDSEDVDEYSDEGMTSDDSDDLAEYADEEMSSENMDEITLYVKKGTSSDDQENVDDEAARLDTDNVNHDLQALRQGRQGQVPGSSGAVYTRWGMNSCPQESTVVYSGFIAGTGSRIPGGAAQYLCIPMEPEYSEYIPKTQSNSILQTAELQTPSKSVPASHRQYLNTPVCAMCQSFRRVSQFMFPARLSCPNGWRKEYDGYLMTAKGTDRRTEYICVDSGPEGLQDTTMNVHGTGLYPVETISKTHVPDAYKEGKELTCSICSK